MRVACEIVLTDNEQLALVSLVHSKLTSVMAGAACAHHAAGRFRDAVSAASPPHLWLKFLKQRSFGPTTA